MVMVRQKPKLLFFARCVVRADKDEPGHQDVIPDTFPFVASLCVCPSVISAAYPSVDIVTNESLAAELAELDMVWKLHPLQWDFPTSYRLTDHVVTRLGDAFIPLKGKKPKASMVGPTTFDIPEGDPLELGAAAAAAGGSSVAVLGAPPTGAGVPAAESVDGPSVEVDALDIDMEELFFGLDLDAREVIASEWFGFEGCFDDSLIPEEEVAAAAEDDGDDASDSSKEFDPAARLDLEGNGDAAAAAESDGAGGGAATGESEGAAPVPATGEPSLDDFVAPRGCSLVYYAHQSKPGQSFWLAKLPKGAPPFEGTKSKTQKYSDDDPVERATAKAFCAAWLQRWSARGSGSGGGAGTGGAVP